MRRQLNEHALDIEPIAQQAAQLFSDAGAATHRRWLTYELQGYGAAVDRAPLAEVLRADELGPLEGPKLVAHVSAYRAQPGATVESPPRAFHHFFVESVRELSASAQRFRGLGAREVRLDFAAGVPGYPAAAVFRGDVFNRVLLGLRATLHLQLGILIR